MEIIVILKYNLKLYNIIFVLNWELIIKFKKYKISVKLFDSHTVYFTECNNKKYQCEKIIDSKTLKDKFKGYSISFDIGITNWKLPQILCNVLEKNN